MLFLYFCKYPICSKNIQNLRKSDEKNWEVKIYINPKYPLSNLLNSPLNNPLNTLIKKAIRYLIQWLILKTQIKNIRSKYRTLIF